MPAHSETIFVLAPTLRDAPAAVQALARAGLSAEACADEGELCERIRVGCGAVIISEEALTHECINKMHVVLDGQPKWSDLPIILLTNADVVQVAKLFSMKGNISLLERPFSRLTLVRAAEVALRARRKQYEVSDLLQELQSSKDDAESANESKSQFLANMSHEIRTPIGAIMGFIELMKGPDETEEQKAGYMQVVERNSQHLLRLIDDILDLSKVEAGKMSIERLRFKLTDLLADLASLMSFKSSERGISFLTHFATPIPEWVISDPVRLRQIISNVAGNAVKFTEVGRVELIVSYQPNKLSIAVHDTGFGISPEQAARLFQPFAQADTSTTRKFGGTGLGLVLSRRLAEALGGSLVLSQSTEGAGSTFTAEIAVEVSPQTRFVGQESLSLSTGATPTTSSSQPLSGLRVLLVEDSPDNQVLITTFLRKAGAEVNSVNDGVEGVQAATVGHYDVVLMDVQMPRMDGHMATRKLRQTRYDRPIIALTAHAMKEEKLKCFESGFTDFLTKPIQMKNLLEVLGRYSHR